MREGSSAKNNAATLCNNMQHQQQRKRKRKQQGHDHQQQKCAVVILAWVDLAPVISDISDVARVDRQCIGAVQPRPFR